MKKLIALFAVMTLASTSAIASIALSGAASVSYDDNGTAASSTTYDADITLTGTAGGTTVVVSADVDGASFATSAATLTTKVGPVTVVADMHDEVSRATDADDTGGSQVEGTDTSVTVSLDVPVGGLTIALDDSGDVSVSGTIAGVTITHVVKSGGDKTTASADIAGVTLNVANDGGTSTWDVKTTVGGVTLTLDSDQDISATMGLAGNTMTVTHVSAVAAAAATDTVFNIVAVNAYTKVAIARDLTSGATLTATYSSLDDSLTLKAAVAF
jgi:hypothetical protein